MKNLIISIILLLSVLVVNTTNAQPAFYLYNATCDSGANVTNAVTLEGGYWVKQIYFPVMKAGTTSYKVLAYNYAISAYDTLYYDDAVFNPTISRAGCIDAPQANALFGIQKLKILLPVAQDADITIKIEAIKQK